MANFSPTSEEICITRGDTPVIPVTVEDDSGTAIDISGGTFLMTVDTSSEPSNSDNNVFQITGVITNGPNGQLTFQPSATNTATAGEFFYDVQMDLNSSIRTILNGSFIILQDITK